MFSIVPYFVLGLIPKLELLSILSIGHISSPLHGFSNSAMLLPIPRFVVACNYFLRFLYGLLHGLTLASAIVITSPF